MPAGLAAPTPPRAHDTRSLLEVTDLTMHFPVTRGLVRRKPVGVVRAVDGVSFSVLPRETLGLVGESGCGKSTLGRTILQLHKPTSGSVSYRGQELTGLSDRRMRPLRRSLQMVLQDPYSSLDPRLTIAASIAEPLARFRIGTRRERRERVAQLLHTVGLDPRFADRFPHEFSGGQRQRVGIARALALQPALIVCDEPISALDVSIQAQIVTLLEDLRDRFELTYLFIAHDLSVVRQLADRVAVMYLGKIVELGGRDQIFEEPRHPYTQALLSAVPIPDPAVERGRPRITLSGDVPSPIDPPSGCRFHPRCAYAQAICREVEPAPEEVRPGHTVACHLWRDVPAWRDLQAGRRLLPRAPQS